MVEIKIEDIAKWKKNKDEIKTVKKHKYPLSK